MNFGTCAVCGARKTLVRGFIRSHTDAQGVECAGSRDTSKETRDAFNANPRNQGDAFWNRFND